MRPNGARRVLKGRRRSNAPPLPDWRAPFYLLEAEGFTCWLLNAKHVKNVPGRPKTDKLDAVWLAKVVERGMCRPSFVPPPPIRRLRDLTRYRRTLIRERTREKQRVEKLLEDAQIKLSSVASDIFGVSGRQMLQAMIGGQRDPKALAQLARASMRSKLRQLEEALTGHFDDHHAFLCQMMLERIDDLSAKVEELTAHIDQQVAPFATQVAQLDAVTGVGGVCAQELIAEIGVDMAVPHCLPPGGVGQVRSPSQHLSRQDQDRIHRQGQPLAGRHPRRDRRHGRANQHLPR